MSPHARRGAVRASGFFARNWIGALLGALLGCASIFLAIWVPPFIVVAFPGALVGGIVARVGRSMGYFSEGFQDLGAIFTVAIVFNILLYCVLGAWAQEALRKMRKRK